MLLQQRSKDLFVSSDKLLGGIGLVERLKWSDSRLKNIRQRSVIMTDGRGDREKMSEHRCSVYRKGSPQHKCVVDNT